MSHSTLPLDRLMIVCLAACCAVSAGRLLAQSPPATRTPAASQTAQEPGYVLLRNGNVLRGEVVQDGAFVSIEKQTVAAIRLPQSEVLCWARSLESLYAYRVQRRKPHSLTAWFDDLQWCIEQGLLDVAREELSQLQQLVPGDARIGPMVSRLNSAVERQAIAAEPPLETTLAETSALDAEHALDSDAAIADVPKHLLVTYTTRMQPLLINRCGQAGCHGGSSQALWQLEHFGIGAHLSAETTRKNLRNLLPWISSEDAAASPLLVRASQPHGDAETAPLDLGDEALESRLRAWIEDMARRSERGDGGGFATHPAGPPMMAASHDQRMPTEADEVGAMAKPTRLPLVKDPFDPAVFNRMYHHRK